MDNGERYAKRITDLEREIRELKTAHYKTATTISTMTETMLLSFDLKLYDYEIWSDKRAIITLTTTDGSNMISACYLNVKVPSSLNDRFWYINRLSSGDGEAKFEVLVYSQNNDDWTTLFNGGSVTVVSNVQVVGSSEFTYSIEYKNVEGGS